MSNLILPVEYKESYIRLLDQTSLPTETKYMEIKTIQQMFDAIKCLAVRGAPAIGIAAAYMLALSMKDTQEADKELFFKELEENKDYLASSRPTAVNLFWALEKMWQAAVLHKEEPIAKIKTALLDQAHRIKTKEQQSCVEIGEHALTLLKDGMGILTHCNAGGVATIRYGTALAPILLGQERGIRFKVFADETRPLLQGARITAWELQQAGVDVTLITDNMAGMVMGQGKIQAVIVGCDRVAANADTANKIGTFSLAVLAKYHSIPFYIAAPLSTIDIKINNGDSIPIEERSSKEVTCGFGKRTAPEGMKVYNPAFDVTPAHLITAIVTNKGILYPPYIDSIAKVLLTK